MWQLRTVVAKILVTFVGGHGQLNMGESERAKACTLEVACPFSGMFMPPTPSVQLTPSRVLVSSVTVAQTPGYITATVSCLFMDS